MKSTLLGFSLVAALAMATISDAAPLYVESFDVDPTANWTVNGGPSDEAADFFFDYSTVGIPSAPNSTGGTTRGMKLQANLTDGVFGGMSVSPTGSSFGSTYKVLFDWWANYNGPAPAGGNGSTNLSTFGVGTAGTSAQWPGGTQDSVWFGATGDGGSSSDYRAYSTAAPTSYPGNHADNVYAAGNVAASTNAAEPYYEALGGAAPPAAQTALFAQQTGNAGPGAPAFQWNQVEIDKGAATTTWRVNGTLIATINNSTVSFGGGNIFFGHSDINATSSTDANDSALLFTLIDNVRVVPEPSSIFLGCLAAMAVGGLRRSAAIRHRHDFV